MTDLSTIDSSINRSALLSTFLIKQYSTTNFLSFSSDNVVSLETFDGKILGSGTYLFDSNGKKITLSFPDDKIQSSYIIKWRNFKTLKLFAHHDGETVNLTLQKKQIVDESRNPVEAKLSSQYISPQKANSRLLTRTEK